jgi:hypothetical protein
LIIQFLRTLGNHQGRKGNSSKVKGLKLELIDGKNKKGKLLTKITENPMSL